MRQLAFDTATPATTVSLCDAVEGLHVQAHEDPAPGERPGHTTRLLPMIVDVLDRAGGGWGAVDQLVVGVGPGTFTGLRIGIATAQALSRALEIPLAGVSTLESLAWNACDPGSAGERPPATVVAVLDARRGEVFAAAWRVGTHGTAAATLARRILDPCALTPEALAACLLGLGPRALAIGSGALALRPALEATRVIIPPDGSALHGVRAGNHCRIALQLEPVGPASIRPEYLRLPDAELARRRNAAATPERN